MKKPRITDFDPNATERELGSPLDDMPTIQPSVKTTTPQLSEIPATRTESSVQDVGKSEQSTSPINTDTVIPRHHDTETPRYHDTTVSESTEDVLELIRKAVRQVGKEPATQRLTLEEKQRLKDVEYTYDRMGIKTSSNEVIRIAINYILNDYAQNGKRSILASVLEKLNS